MRNTISYRIVVKLLLVVGMSVFISGCGTTLSPVKRKPLEIIPFETSLTPSPQKILVQFESTLPGAPLVETVWDNASGAFVDDEESKQIGFTQNYPKLMPIVIGGAVGGAIGGLVAGTSSATQPDYTRIVIPFGRIFQDVFQSGLQKAFTNSSVCSDDANESEKLQSATLNHIIRLKVTEFQVWEKPLNHLNMKATVECKVYRPGSLDQLEYVYDAHREITNQSIGSVMTTSRGFVKKMDEISNQFAAGLSEDILENLQQKIGFTP
jgi:hypothetical protein